MDPWTVDLSSALRADRLVLTVVVLRWQRPGILIDLVLTTLQRCRVPESGVPCLSASPLVTASLRKPKRIQSPKPSANSGRKPFVKSCFHWVDLTFENGLQLYFYLGWAPESWRIEWLVFLIPWCTEVSSSLGWHREAGLAALLCTSRLSKSLLLPPPPGWDGAYL